jgi:drug/metabolite transporter (DMT)-like permease
MASQALTRMALVSAVCWAVVSLVTSRTDRTGVTLGVAGPLVVASAAWVLMERASRRAPERLSALMIKLFAAKMLLFGAYVAAVVMLLPTGSIAFVVSFTTTYAVLHVMEALYLRRLFSRRAAA